MPRFVSVCAFVGAVRTPIGKHGGSLKDVRPDDLAAHVIRALVETTGVDPADAATKKSDGKFATDYTKGLNAAALKGAA